MALGHQQPESRWLAELRFNACELPCWNGIVPGHTPFAEARQRVNELYSDTTNYRVINSFDRPDFLLLHVTNRVTRYSFTVHVVAHSFSRSGQVPVLFIRLSPLFEEQSNVRPALLADFYSLLGHVEGMAIAETSITYAMLFYIDGQVGVGVHLLPCNKVLLGHEIADIYLYDSTFLEEMGWLSNEVLEWRGFGRCYES